MRRILKKLAMVDGPDLARPVSVKLRRYKTDKGEVCELIIRPICSRSPVRISLDTLVRLALNPDSSCLCLLGGGPGSSARRPEVDSCQAEFPAVAAALGAVESRVAS